VVLVQVNRSKRQWTARCSRATRYRVAIAHRQGSLDKRAKSSVRLPGTSPSSHGSSTNSSCFLPVLWCPATPKLRALTAKICSTSIAGSRYVSTIPPTSRRIPVLLYGYYADTAVVRSQAPTGRPKTQRQGNRAIARRREPTCVWRGRFRNASTRNAPRPHCQVLNHDTRMSKVVLSLRWGIGRTKQMRWLVAMSGQGRMGAQ
jgi:hypothetical protein